MFVMFLTAIAITDPGRQTTFVTALDLEVGSPKRATYSKPRDAEELDEVRMDEESDRN